MIHSYIPIYKQMNVYKKKYFKKEFICGIHRFLVSLPSLSGKPKNEKKVSVVDNNFGEI